MLPAFRQVLDDGSAYLIWSYSILRFECGLVNVLRIE